MFELVFFTSSRVKLAHAIYLCRDYDIQIIGFREKTFGANYVEPRILDREQLIEFSYRDALERWGKAASVERPFFIEDTSVTINALSVKREVPGVDIKYWMSDMDFQRLDADLKARGNDRKVTVRSDVVLHLTPDMRGREKRSYLQFTSMMAGTIVNREEAFNTNPTYPWLDNSTFNKWFSPAKHSRSISTLPIVEADRHDFRAGAFREMLEYLESQKQVVRRSRPEVQGHFDFGPRLFIVCGPSCAGKTTLAEYLGRHYGYYHVEASDFMYRAYYRRHGTNSKVAIGDFAEQVLEEEPDIVARQILENIGEHVQTPVVVTGFRSSAEIDWFSSNYAGIYSIEPLYVTASESIRYARAMLRGREGEASERDEFVRRDDQQRAMGLSELERRLKDNTLKNDGSFPEYFSKFEKKYSPDPTTYGVVTTHRQAASNRLEDAILLALAQKWDGREYFTTTEISQLINRGRPDSPKNKNNISRYFNQLFYPYFEIKVVNRKRKYRLSNTGRGRVFAFFEHEAMPGNFSAGSPKMPANGESPTG
jgi:dephospho-CoA kinase/inosine/xanthosine triphosphate pyrophosphatase family protein